MPNSVWIGYSVPSSQPLPSGTCINWNNDTFLSRQSAGVVGVGTSCGGVQGTISAAKYLAGDGAAAAPSVAFASETTKGFWSPGAQSVDYVGSGGSSSIRFGAGELAMRSDVLLRWSSGALGSSADLNLLRDAANTLAQRNGTNAQTFRWYKTTGQYAYVDTTGILIGTSGFALTNGAAAQLGTLTNAPTAGDPTKWIPINDNGTTRYIPAW